MRPPSSWASAGAAPNASPASITVVESRMSGALLLQTRDDSRRPGVVAFSHFVDQRDGVLQQSDLGLEALDQALLRRLAGRLRSHGGAAFADRLVDDREILLQRRGGARVEIALRGVGDRLEPLDRVLVVHLGLPQLGLDRLRRARTGRAARGHAPRPGGWPPAGGGAEGAPEGRRPLPMKL